MNDSIAELQKEIAEWADKVFPNRTAHGSLSKLVLEEIPEFITSGMEDPLEYADLVIMILDIAHLKGINVGQAVIQKMAINRSRTWTLDDATGFLKHVEEIPKPSMWIHDVMKARGNSD
jgi:predicted house-cleaning noncanonical NTP pyrophosphatase (MazG superfamily)